MEYHDMPRELLHLFAQYRSTIWDGAFKFHMHPRVRKCIIALKKHNYDTDQFGATSNFVVSTY